MAFLTMPLMVEEAFAQLRVDNLGNTILRHGTFSPSSDANLFLGDQTHFIKSKFGYGVQIGTGGVATLRMPQYTGWVGIMREPQYTLDVGGLIRGYNLVPSDLKLKRNISSLDKEKSKLLLVDGFSYTYEIANDSLGLENQMNGTVHFGFIAQELRKVYPDLVYEDSHGVLSVDYISFIPLLVERVNDMAEQIEKLENELEITSQNKRMDSNNRSSYLAQNIPNPFSNETLIEYRIDGAYSASFILICDLQGQQKMSISLGQESSGTKTISNSVLTPGIYLYSLIVDDKIIDTKKMVLLAK
jgi:hypothetical protein